MRTRHPLHPAIVHFPIACWTLVAAADFAGHWLGEAAWRWSGGLLAVGCATGVLAVAAGLLELPRIPEGAALRDTWLHMSCMLVAFAFFVTRWLLPSGPVQSRPPGGLALLLDVCGFLALAVGGFLGGRLVYGHGIGRR